MNILQNKIEWALSGVAIGDALGLPFEFYTWKEVQRILERENISKETLSSYPRIGINGFFSETQEIAPEKRSQVEVFKKRLNIDNTSVWIASDDTLLTLSLAESLVHNKKILLGDIFSREAKMIEIQPFNFWKGTRSTIDLIQNGKKPSEIHQLSFWNGFTMKQLPLAFYLLKNPHLDKESVISQICRVTHGSNIALSIAILHNTLLEVLLSQKDGNFDFFDWLQKEEKLFSTLENRYSLERKYLSELREKLLHHIPNSWDLLEQFSVRLSETEERIEFNILSTIGICYALFLEAQEFKSVVKWATLGGDSDSYAGIVGGMIGAFKGVFYPDWTIDTLHPFYKNFLIQTIRDFKDFIG